MESSSHRLGHGKALKLIPVLGILISVGCLFFIFRRINFALLVQTFQGLKISWVVAMVLAYLAGFLLRGWRWHFMLLPIKRIAPRMTTEGIIVGYMANNILPARAGEFIRALIIGLRESISKASALGTIAVERIFDGVVILGILMLSSLFLREERPELQFLNWMFILGGGIFGGACLIVFFGYYCSGGIQKWVRFISQYLPADLARVLNQITCDFLSSLNFFGSGRHFYLVLLFSVLVWIVEGLVFWAGFRALELEAGLLAAYFTLALVNLAMLIPSGPAGIGVFQEGAILALSIFGIPAEKAFGYSVVVHGAMIIPITILGFLILNRCGISLLRMRRGKLEAKLEVVPRENHTFFPHREKASPSVNPGGVGSK